jgi:hypothetical protein
MTSLLLVRDGFAQAFDRMLRTRAATPAPTPAEP